MVHIYREYKNNIFPKLLESPNVLPEDKIKIKELFEVTNALCEIALKCDSCAVQFRQIIQDYRNNNGVNPSKGHPSLEATNENVGISNDSCFPEDELQEIEGVGPTTARKFIAEGFKTVESIANADVDQITEALSCSEDTANAFIELAKKVFNKRGREGFDNIFGGEDTDAANEEKPDDYGFIKVRECERKMTDDFTSQIENDDDFQPMLDRIDELADDIEELNNKSRRSSEDDDSEEE